jgi:hypothetical protein
MRKSIFRAAIAAAGLLSAASIASAAQADTYNITGYSVPYGVNGRLYAPTLNAGGEGAQMGQIVFTGKDLTTSLDVTLSVFCIDVADILTTGTFQGYDLNTTQTGPIAALGYSADALNSVGYLLDHYAAGAAGNSTKSAGLQLAIWEVLNESGHAWNVTDGLFHVGNYDADLTVTGGVNETANSYLTNLGTALSAQGGIGNYNLTVLQPLSPGVGHNQSQILALVTAYSPPPGDHIGLGVPEPATWGMIVLGFGMLGSALRRRKQEDVFA